MWGLCRLLEVHDVTVITRGTTAGLSDTLWNWRFFSERFGACFKNAFHFPHAPTCRAQTLMFHKFRHFEVLDDGSTTESSWMSLTVADFSRYMHAKSGMLFAQNIGNISQPCHAACSSGNVGRCIPPMGPHIMGKWKAIVEGTAGIKPARITISCLNSSWASSCPVAAERSCPADSGTALALHTT